MQQTAKKACKQEAEERRREGSKQERAIEKSYQWGGHD